MTGPVCLAGSFEKSYNLLYMRADTPYKTIHDVTKAAEGPKCGSTGTGGLAYLLMKFLNEAIGTKCNIVTGYQGGQEIDLAVERGEVHCRACTVTSFFAREPSIAAKKRICSGADSDRQEEGCEIIRRADGIRANGRI